MKLKAIAFAVSGLVLTAPAAMATQSRSGQDLAPEERGAYVAVSGAFQVYEKRAAELALEKARRPEVRAFAEAVLADHPEASERLDSAARAAGLEELLPPAMMPMHWDMLRRLERARASRFDDTYAEQQIEAHELEVELHRNFAANGHGVRLQAHAEAALPAATRHLDQARRLDP